MKWTVKVIPRASKNEVFKLEDGLLKVRLTAPPVDGAGNQALIEVLAEHFEVRRSQVHILRGETFRMKLVEIV